MIQKSNSIRLELELKHIFETNRYAWNLITPEHEYSSFYCIDKFIKTKNSLNSIELDALGNITGKKILHLQPHICNDSISMAEKGAIVTVVDFSNEAIRIGKKLSDMLNVRLDFIEDNVLNIGFENEFDIVFLSYGALCWIPDLEYYFNLIHTALKKGGLFYFVDFHSNLLCYDTVTNKRKYDATSPQEPIHELRSGSYAGPVGHKEYEVYYWIHSVPDIVNSLLNAGFNLSQIEEFDYLPFDCFPGLEQSGITWKFKGELKGLPLLLSVKSHK